MIYLDHNATSPPRPGVVAAMLPYLEGHVGNPSSVHGAGRAARQGVEEARRRLADALGVHDSQVVFTSCGTESNNGAILGVLARHGFAGHLVTSPVEHPSVAQVCNLARRRGVRVTELPVDGQGRVDPEAVSAALEPDTRLVTVMHANNETGVLQPIAEIAARCRAAGVPLHTDAVQSVGRLAVAMEELGVDLLTLSGHKFGGPKGVGALVLAKGLQWEAPLVGGGQERGRRSGTENVAGIVGMGAALEHALADRAGEAERLAGLRDAMEQRLRERLPDLVVLGGGAERLPNTSALALSGLDGPALVMTLDLMGVCVSSGSACAAGRAGASSVTTAMGVAPELGRSLVRVSLGWNTTAEGVERFIQGFERAVARLRRMGESLSH